MKTLLSITVCMLLALSSFGQTQGVSQRATNGVAFGEMIVQDHVLGTNTASTNTFAGKFQQGSGTTASGTSASAFGINSRSLGSASFVTGIGNSSTGAGSLTAGTSNNIQNSAPYSLAVGRGNRALDPSDFVTGTSNIVAGSNSLVSGFNIIMEAESPNSVAIGQNISVLSGSSNNFVWNSDPASILTIPVSRSNSFTVNAPGGIFLNGSVSGVGTGMKTNQFTTNTVGVPIVGNVNLGGATNNATGDFGVNGIFGSATANAGTLAVSGSATVNGTLTSSTSTSGVFTVTGSILAPFTNQYPYFDANGVMRGTNNGGGFTNISSGAPLNGTNTWTGTNTFTVGSRTFKHGGDSTTITNTASLTGSEWSGGQPKGYYNGTVTETHDRTNGNLTLIGNLTVPTYGGISNAAVTGTNVIVDNLKFRVQEGGANTIVATNNNVGIGVIPLNKLDIAGGMVIGGTAAGSVTAPAHGLYVQGDITAPRIGNAGTQFNLNSSGAFLFGNGGGNYVEIGTFGIRGNSDNAVDIGVPNRFRNLNIGSNAVIANITTSSNGFASYATNYFPSPSTSGFTNSSSGAGGGTNSLFCVFTGVTSGSVEFYGRSGLNGQTVCGLGWWTNTPILSTSFPVGVNCGFVIRSGVGISYVIQPGL